MFARWMEKVTAVAAAMILAGCASNAGWRDIKDDVVLEMPSEVKQELGAKVSALSVPAAPVHLHVVQDIQRTSMMLTDDIHNEADELHVLRPDGLLETTRSDRTSNARSKGGGRSQQLSLCGLFPLLAQTSASTASEGTTVVPVGRTLMPLNFNSGFSAGTRMRVSSLQLSSARICAPQPGDRFSATFDTELQFRFDGSMISRNRMLARAEHVECEVDGDVVPATVIDPSLAGEALRVSCVQARKLKDDPQTLVPDLRFERLFVRNWGWYLPKPDDAQASAARIHYKVLP